MPVNHSFLKCLFNVGKRCTRSIKLIEIHSRLFCNNACSRGFTRSGRTKEYHIGHSSLFHHLAQNSALAEKVRLPNYLVKSLWAKNVSQHLVFVCQFYHLHSSEHTHLLYHFSTILSIWQYTPFMPIIVP